MLSIVLSIKLLYSIDNMLQLSHQLVLLLINESLHFQTFLLSLTQLIDRKYHREIG